MESVLAAQQKWLIWMGDASAYLIITKVAQKFVKDAWDRRTGRNAGEITAE